jgi:hypothetical protein
MRANVPAGNRAYHFEVPLSARGERPRRSRATEERDELAPSYVEHGASPPLRALDASNDHQPATAHAVGCWRLTLPLRMGEILGADLIGAT